MDGKQEFIEFTKHKNYEKKKLNKTLQRIIQKWRLTPPSNLQKFKLFLQSLK